VTYGEVRRDEEIEHSVYSFQAADVEFLRQSFGRCEAEVERLLERRLPIADTPAPLVLPAYEATLRCSHLFNVLDARGALSVTERAATIQRIRRLACRCAESWLVVRRARGFPLLRDRSVPGTATP
jgi:glycyl-tRNA synthetase alpha chain